MHYYVVYFCLFVCLRMDGSHFLKMKVTILKTLLNFSTNNFLEKQIIMHYIDALIALICLFVNE